MPRMPSMASHSRGNRRKHYRQAVRRASAAPSDPGSVVTGFPAFHQPHRELTSDSARAKMHGQLIACQSGANAQQGNGPDGTISGQGTTVTGPADSGP